jgi:hypothetical protein
LSFGAAFGREIIGLMGRGKQCLDLEVGTQGENVLDKETCEQQMQVDDSVKTSVDAVAPNDSSKDAFTLNDHQMALRWKNSIASLCFFSMQSAALALHRWWTS